MVGVLLSWVEFILMVEGFTISVIIVTGICSIRSIPMFGVGVVRPFSVVSV